MIKDIIIYGGFSGITVFIGGLAALFFNRKMDKSPLRDEITHTLMSFGAGIMLSAIALVLVPKGLKTLSLWPIILSFLAGTLLFMFLDVKLASKGGKTATVLAMMMDFVPESIALGAVFASDHKLAILLALFIGLQNLPEAFNAFEDLHESGFESKKILILFFILSFAGIAGAMLGHFLLQDYERLTAGLMIFAGGGILYLLIQDIIPASSMKKHYLVSAGAGLGFLVGIIGNQVA